MTETTNLRERTRTEALGRHIAARLLLCNFDELRVLDILLMRLELGRERYGFLDLNAPRDWKREEAEELIDAVVYRACQTLQQRDEQVAKVERGLVELRRQTNWPAQDWPGEHDLDLGGEG